LIINDNKIEFDKLENVIYKIDGKELKSIKFTNNLEFSNLKGGTFFIAKHGLGVKQRYSKYEIFQTLLSLLRCCHLDKKIDEGQLIKEVDYHRFKFARP
jgi:hypothetical protein